MTTVSIEVDGLAETIKRLHSIGAIGDDAVQDIVQEAALTTERYAVTGIRGGAASGRVYKRGGTTHQASAAGQYPASDSGWLAKNIRSEFMGSTAYVGTNVAYGQFLEFGTSRMAARPWLLRSFRQAIDGLDKQLKAKFEGRL